MTCALVHCHEKVKLLIDNFRQCFCLMTSSSLNVGSALCSTMTTLSDERVTPHDAACCGRVRPRNGYYALMRCLAELCTILDCGARPAITPGL